MNDEKIIQTAIITNKNRVTLSSVRIVECFNDRIVRLHTSVGDICVKGSDLEVECADTDDGEAIICGKISSVHFSEKNEHIPVNFISRLFR